MNPEQSVTKKHQEQLTLASKVRKRAAALEKKRKVERQKLINKTRQQQLKRDTANRKACDEAIKRGMEAHHRTIASKPIKKASKKNAYSVKSPALNAKKATKRLFDSELLNVSELKFLDTQNLTIDDVYDGRLESKSDYSRNAKQLGKSVVIGSKCKLQGHRLRTRSGHCIQCHPSKIAYASRHSEAANLYIAGSYISKILKVGLTKNIPKREQSLINQSYGGLDDWQIICSIRIPNAGAVESQVHAALQKYKIIKYYIKDGLEQQAEELVEVSLRILLRELIACLKDAQIKDPEKSLKWTKSKTGLIKFYS